MLDDTSFDGKVVGSVLDYANEANKHTIAIVGDIDDAMDDELRAEIEAVSITEMFGNDMAMQQVLRCIEDAASELLKKLIR